MVTDKKGNIFEDRRKEVNDRRQNDFDKDGGRRKVGRRKADRKLEEHSSK